MTQVAAAAPRALLERLEPRILYSADAAAVAHAVGIDAPAHELRLQQDEQASHVTARIEIAFVDLSVPDTQGLIADLQAQRSAGRPIEIVTIDAAQDGVALIGATLAGRQDITAVHVLAHGSDGVLQLGNARLDDKSLIQRAGEVAGWGIALAADADLLLYGCDVAQTVAGQQFVADLAALTGADVAASTDVTGAAARGGNWALEFGSGRIDAAAAIGVAAQQAWAGTLAVALTSESSGGTTSATTSYSFSHNVNAGSDRLLLVELVIRDGVGASAVDFNGTALTFLAGQNAPSDDVRVEVWYLVAPTVASGTVDVTLASSSTLVAGATSYSGVNQAAPFGSRATTSGINALPFAMVAANSGDLVVDIVGARSVAGNVIGLGQTQNFIRNQGTGANDLFGVSSREDGAASVWMSHAFFGANTRWAEIAVQINQTGTSAQITAAQDTYIDSGSTNNYGPATSLVVDRAGGSALGNGRALLQFDLSAIPAGATITNATLQMQATANGGAFDIEVHRLTEAWVEGSGGTSAANWTQRLPGTNWTSAGGSYDPTAEATLNTGAIGQHSWNLTSLAQGWHDGSVANYGIVIGSPDSGTTTITYDSSEGTTPPRLVVTYTLAANTAPTLDAGISAPLQTIPEDAGAPAGAVGTLVSSLVDFAVPAGQRDNVTDPDAGAQLGIAVTAADTSNGSWFYSSNDGTTWNPLGAVSDSAARLLAADLTTRLFFQPNADFNGTLANAIAFRAWDRTDPGVGGVANIVASGGSTAFSSNTASASITVAAVNDAPRASGSAALAAVNEDTLSPAGATVASLFGANFSDPADAGTTAQNQFAGVVVRGQSVDATEGRWQYSIDGGTNWSNFGAVSDTNALALGLTDRLRFLPAADYHGTPNDLSVRLVDNSISITSGSTVDASSNGSTHPFSAATVVTSTSVLSVNERPAGTSSTISVAEDTGRALTRSDFGFLDANGESDDFASVLVQLPSAGTLTLSGIAITGPTEVTTSQLDAAQLVFTPVANANGTAYATLSFQVRDDGGTANGGIDLDPTPNTLTVNVMPANDAPVLAQPIANQTATQGAVFGFTLPAGTFADPDAGDTLSYSATLASGAALPSWLAFNAATRTFSGTPANADVGAISVRVTAIDGASATALGDFTLSVVNTNDAPTVATPIADLGATEDALFSFTLPAGAFADIDAGDTLTYSASGLPSWLAFNASTRTFSGTPTNAAVGSATISVTATDAAGATATDSFVLTVANTNDAPTVATPIADRNATEDTPFVFALPAASFADADAGDILSYSATLSSGAALPSWLSFDAATRSFSGTPVNADVGAMTIRVTATDGTGSSVADDFVLTVGNSNDAPTVATPIADSNATEDAAFSYALPAFTFADVDAGDTLTYSATLSSGAALPAWLNFNAATRSFSGTPANADVGAITIRVTATDGALASVSDDFVLTVANINDAPRFASHGGAAAAAVGMTENATAADTLQALDDDANTTLGYTISGGADAAALRIDAQTGALTFVTAPDFEQPADANGDGRYEVEITASDGAATVRQALSISVLNVNEAPTVQTHTLIVYDGSATLVLRATDVDTAPASLVYRVVSSSGGRFESSNGGTGLQSFTQADVDAGRVAFVQDGSGLALSYQLELRDGSSVVAVIAPTAVYQQSATPPTTTLSTPGSSTTAPSAAAPAEATAPEVTSAVADAAARPPAPPPLDQSFAAAAAFESSQAAAAAAAAAPAQGSARNAGDAAREQDWTALNVNLLSDDAALAVSPAQTLNLDPTASASARAFADQLDRMRQQLGGDEGSFSVGAASATALATGLSAGYVLWLLRGGVLLASLISSVPVWAAVDPLPVLGRMRRSQDDDDDDAFSGDKDDDQIERLFSRARRIAARPVEVAPPPVAPAAAPTAAHDGHVATETTA